MKIETNQLILELTEQTNEIITKVEELKKLPIEKLNFKSSSEQWSSLECIEHLNLYGDYYNPEIRKSIENNNTKPSKNYKGGILGNYFTKIMLPSEKVNKMKTFANKNPNNSKLSIDVLDKFLAQQREFIDLIALSNGVNISKTRTGISISKIIRLKLGDTLRFNVAHNQRHVLQAEKATI